MPSQNSSYDHRSVGRELDLFCSDELVGAGLPMWLPDGAIVRDTLARWIVDLERSHGDQHVCSPPIAKRALYEISGHWDHYADGMWPPMRMGDEEYVLRPMNCPHHILLFRHQRRSYRELPLRFAELGTMFRNELSGAIGGLSRVRCMTLNDAHAFCTPEQVASEISGALAMIEAAYADLGLGSHRYRLSCRGDGDKYVADDDLWARATSVLREVLADSGVEYFEADDEAAFYGPKIDVQLAGAHGREETVSTIQVDLLLPERFDLTYLDANDERQRPVIVHRSVISTLERMVAHLVDRHGPALPPWLAPRQVVVLPVSAAYDADADGLAARLRAAFLRVEVDRDGTLGARIAAHRAAVPWLAVVGEREAAGNTVAVRARDGRQFAVDQGAFVGAASNIVAAHGHDLGV